MHPAEMTCEQLAARARERMAVFDGLSRGWRRLADEYSGNWVAVARKRRMTIRDAERMFIEWRARRQRQTLEAAA